MNTYLDRAQVLIDLERWTQAGDELRRELTERPGNPLAHRLLALCLACQDSLSEARAEVEEAIRLQPDSDHAHQILGWILVKQRRYPEAEKAYREAIRLNPQGSHHFFMLSNLCALTGEWSASENIAREGLRINPDDVNCANALAVALVEKKELKEAQAVLDAAIAQDPENSGSHVNRGWFYMRQFNIAKSLEHFHEAARIDPENNEAHEYITYIRYHRIASLGILLLIIGAFVVRYIVQLTTGR